MDGEQVGGLKQCVHFTICLQILSCSPLKSCGAFLFSYSELQNYFVTSSLFYPVEILATGTQLLCIEAPKPQ